MTETDHEEIPLVEGDEQEPDVAINPVDDDADPEDDDPDNAGIENVPDESWLADPHDDKGLSELCGGHDG
jgi:hypothetical protein